MVSQTSIVDDPYGVIRHKREDEEARAAVVRLRLLKPARPQMGEFALPEIPRLHHAARRIDSEGEGELRWFFSGPPIASVSSSSGAFGNQLEIASAFGFGSLPCRRCGGRFRTRKRGAKETIVDWRDGTGMAPKDHFGQRVTYAAALAQYRKRMQKEHQIVLTSKPEPREGIDPDQAWEAMVWAFKAQGKVLMTDQAFRAAYDRVPDEHCKPCLPCQGIGVVPRRAAAHVEVTAYPTGSSKHGSGKADDGSQPERQIKKGVLRDGAVVVSLRELDRYRDMRTILADVVGMSPIALESLEEYYCQENGQRALERFVEERFGLVGPARLRAASQLRDHQCQVYNIAAFGAQ